MIKNSLKDKQFRLSINTTKHNPIEDLFDPALSHAIEYSIAVGYFSSKWVRDAANGLTKFALKGGKARWVVSPELSEQDFNAINIGDTKHLKSIIRHSFETLYKALKEDTRTALSWLIADGVLEFRIAVPKNKLRGLMHAKMGYFVDECGNKVGFSGSYNATGAASTNWEKIEVYCDWKSEESSDRVQTIVEEFCDMWESQDPNLAIHRVSEIELLPFTDHAKSTSRPYKLKSVEKEALNGPRIPSKFLNDRGKLGREYQSQANAEWFKANGRGILAMATGSGKTITSLSAATKLAQHAKKQNSKLLIVVLVPYTHLAEQWKDEAVEFNFSPILCYGGTYKWMSKAQQALTEFRAGAQDVVMLIVVNDTFSSEVFLPLISDFQETTLLIADEMHNLGARTYLRALPKNIKFRLGLSATPVRHGDEEGTQGLSDFFGDTVFEFSLADAIEAKFLCEYYYYPVLCPLNSDEMDEYKGLSIRIARLYASGSKDSTSEDGQRLQKLLIERARLLGRIESKISNLRNLMAKRTDSTHNLVYCGDSQVDNERQIEHVVRLLGQELGQKVSKFTAEESPEEREDLIFRFGSGDLQTLAAIRCLDEGVDIPRTETAFILASSTNPRQYVQRRGRVLRKAPGKTYAYIYDFIAVPNLDELSGLGNEQLKTEKRLVEKELVRVNEFVDLSLNSGESIQSIREIRRRLNITTL